MCWWWLRDLIMWAELKFPPINLHNVWPIDAAANYHASKQDPTLWDRSIDGDLEVITIYGKPNCPYCDMAKKLCETKGLPYTYIDIVAEGMSAANLSEKLGRPVRAVPQILADNEYVGGYEALQAYVMPRESTADAKQ